MGDDAGRPARFAMILPADVGTTVRVPHRLGTRTVVLHVTGPGPRHEVVVVGPPEPIDDDTTLLRAAWPLPGYTVTVWPAS